MATKQTVEKKVTKVNPPEQTEVKKSPYESKARFVEAEVIGTAYLPADEARGFSEKFEITFRDKDNNAHDFDAFVGTEPQRKRLQKAVLSCNVDDFGAIQEGTWVLLQIGWSARRNRNEVNHVLHLDPVRRKEIASEVYDG